MSYPEYNPKVGPVITPAMWTYEMLIAPLTQELMANQVDPAGFQNSRKALRLIPTATYVRSNYDGSTQPINPQAMATQAEADAMLARLQGLGLKPDVAITDQSPVGGYSVVWSPFDIRRLLGVGPFSVGGLMMRYATTPVPLADDQTMKEMKEAGLAK